MTLPWCSTTVWFRGRIGDPDENEHPSSEPKDARWLRQVHARVLLLGYSPNGEYPLQNGAGCPFRIFGPASGWVSNQSMREWFEVTKNPIFIQICTPFCHAKSLHLGLYYWFGFSCLDQNCNLACRLDRLILTLRTPLCSSECFFKCIKNFAMMFFKCLSMSSYFANSESSRDIILHPFFCCK